MPLKDFDEILARDLQDPEAVAAYLEYALQDGGMETFLVALRNVARVQGGMTQLAQATARGRESLYKTLSEQGNPEFETLQAVLSALGLRFSITRAETAPATVSA